MLKKALWNKHSSSLIKSELRKHFSQIYQKLSWKTGFKPQDNMYNKWYFKNFFRSVSVAHRHALII